VVGTEPLDFLVKVGWAATSRRYSVGPEGQSGQLLLGGMAVGESHFGAAERALESKEAMTQSRETVVTSLGRTVVVIPTYNEADNLEWIVERVRAATPAVDVLVVDDGSPDGTGEVADGLAARYPQVQVLHRTEKQGLGAAYLHGFAVALERGYDVVCEMDADGSHQPEQLPLLLNSLHDADLVLGSRWVPGGSVENWSRCREAISRGGNLYARLLLGIPVRDATGGFRAFRRTTLESLDLAEVRSIGYCFQTDLVWRATQAGLRVVEVPIAFVERVRGESKITGAVAVESLARITAWGVHERRRQLTNLAFRRMLASGRRFLHELVKFGLVGTLALLADLVVFNALRYNGDLWSGPLTDQPIGAKVVSAAVATVVAYAGNRHWTWRDRRRRGLRREGILFVACNVGGMSVAVTCLAFSHYLLGFTSALADNLSANVVGLALGSLFRFWSYRTWVFPSQAQLAEAQGPLVQTDPGRPRATDECRVQPRQITGLSA
jgi:dolichol-phosphate mannosyltransferase